MKKQIIYTALAGALLAAPMNSANASGAAAEEELDVGGQIAPTPAAAVADPEEVHGTAATRLEEAQYEWGDEIKIIMPALYDLGVALDLPINLALIMDSPDEELFSQLSMSLGRPFPEGIEKLISGWIQGLINAHQAFMIVDEFRADCDSGQLIIPHTEKNN